MAKSQTNWVIGQLVKFHPQVKIEIVEIVTQGDKILDTALSKVPGKGVFVKEIEDKLLSKEIDLAVHSMKDLPTEFPEGLTVGATSARVDPRDVFISRHNLNLADLPANSRIGTSSLRRQAQLLNYRNDLEILDIRGNIDTRLNKSETEPYDGILLAAAGLIRMGWDDRIHEFLSCEVMVPAVGQGALGIEIRKDDPEIKTLLEPFNDTETQLAVAAERTFLAAMGGGCQTPMGAFCRVRDNKIVFHAVHSEEDGSNFKRERVEAPLDAAQHTAMKIVEKFKSAS